MDLSWNKVTDAIGYLVYRWNPTTKAYEKLTTRPVTGTTYTDSAPPTGTTHFYQVTASYPDGEESAPGGNHAILPPPHQ